MWTIFKKNQTKTYRYVNYLKKQTNKQKLTVMWNILKK